MENKNRIIGVCATSVYAYSINSTSHLLQQYQSPPVVQEKVKPRYLTTGFFKRRRAKCAHCGSKFTADAHGNCAACGAQES